MHRSRRTGLFFGGMAAVLWSTNLPMMERIAGETGVSQVVVVFHTVFWAAAALYLLMFLSGRLDEIGVFNRRETSFLVLAATGGYGFWLLRALALEQAGNSAQGQLYAYTAPLFMGGFALFSRGESLEGRTAFGLLLGFVGAILLAQARADLSGAQGLAAGLGAGACLGLFTVMARPVVREENVLPSLALVLGIGAACLLVTCVSRGDRVLDVSLAQVGLSALVGVLSVALMMATWLTCLSAVSVATAAPVWYLGAAFGMLWRGLGPAELNVWMAVGGIILVILGLYGAGGSRQERPGLTFGDILRDE